MNDSEPIGTNLHNEGRTGLSPDLLDMADLTPQKQIPRSGSPGKIVDPTTSTLFIGTTHLCSLKLWDSGHNLQNSTISHKKTPGVDPPLSQTHLGQQGLLQEEKRPTEASTMQICSVFSPMH